MLQVEGLYGLAIHENFLFGIMQRNNTLVRMEKLDNPLVSAMILVEEVKNPAAIKVVHRQRQPVNATGGTEIPSVM